MIRLFVDSDIILDLLAQSEPHYIHAARLFILIDQKKLLLIHLPSYSQISTIF